MSQRFLPESKVARSRESAERDDAARAGSTSQAPVRRVRVTAWGIVQGVGFRPFVVRAALSSGLSGWVRNGSDAVRLEVQGPQEKLLAFLRALESPPSRARIDRREVIELATKAESGFRILESDPEAAPRPTLPADLAICAECSAEMDDPSDRRYKYPFINCTQCGPRYSIVRALPYDRPETSMARFTLCEACAREYDDPANRRFHAQPTACSECGPHVRLIERSGRSIAEGDEAVVLAARRLLAGHVLALQGLGGFQFLVDATDDGAVLELRKRKHRDEKPFAVMFPSLDAVSLACALSAAEKEALGGPFSPILLVRKANGAHALARGIAPENPRLGVMVPYTPLHRLLLAEVNRPLVCTSGNLSEEPMCVNEEEARARLAEVADVFLVHDRPVVRPVDDSVARVDSDGLQVLRRARGFAPLPLALGSTRGRTLLATGAHLKSTAALAKDGQVVVSQHLGDLTSFEGATRLEETVEDFVRFFHARPEGVACDLHPDYASTRLAEKLAARWEVPLERVQHHHAHVAACVAEHGLEGPVLGLAWDGSGLGPDGTLWGGEALVVDGAAYRRVAHLRSFLLPGGERAMRDPSRCALSLLYEVFGEAAGDYVGLGDARTRALLSMLATKTNCPAISSMGRLFDAVAALTGVFTRTGYEAQAAMALEFAAEAVEDEAKYPFRLSGSDPAVVDWEPLLRALLSDRARATRADAMAARFHNTLVDVAEAICERVGLGRVVLTGGCFQNLHLAERVRARLRSRGFEVFTPRLYPPNDGGVSLGQIHVVAQKRGGA